jgi:hypothetical protein
VGIADNWASTCGLGIWLLVGNEPFKQTIINGAHTFQVILFCIVSTQAMQPASILLAELGGGPDFKKYRDVVGKGAASFSPTPVRLCRTSQTSASSMPTGQG